jgi:hypothetical protein
MTISAQMRLGDGLGELGERPGTVRLFVASAPGAVVFGESVNLVRGTWVSVALAPDAPANAAPTFDATNIIQLGIEVATGSDDQAYRPATLLLDNITWE